MRSYVWPSAIVSTGPSLRARGIPSLPLGGAIVVTEPIPNDLFIEPADVEAPATDSQVLATTRWFVNRFASLDDSTMAIDARLRYSLAGRDIEVPLVYVPPRPLAVLDASETLVPAIVEAFEETLDDVAGDEVRLVLGVEIHVDELPLVEFEQIVFDQSQ